MDERHAMTLRAGALGILALCGLVGCNAGPEREPASAQVKAAVAALTDRTGGQQDVVVLPNGERLRRMSVPEGFNHVMLGRRTADGKPSMACVDSVPAAEAFLAPAPAPAGNAR
jgi:hypothetical protein